MKILKYVKGASNGIKKAGLGLSLLGFSSMAFAAIGSSEDTSMTDLTDLLDKATSTGGTIYKIAVVIATLAGLILIIKGLVHLKQNYTGTGQEKHLSKGIASLGFGVALILAVPLSHALVSTGSASTSFTTGAGAVDFSTTTTK